MWSDPPTYAGIGSRATSSRTTTTHTVRESGTNLSHGEKKKMKIEFFMPMIPPTITAQEHKVKIVNGKPVFYDPPELKQAKDKLIGHLVKYKPKRKYEGPVRLVVKWCFPLSGKHSNGEYKHTKPDTDNLQKMLKDCMTKCGYWKDDALVASEVVEKFWAEVPGIYICIEEI